MTGTVLRLYTDYAGSSIIRGAEFPSNTGNAADGVRHGTLNIERDRTTTSLQTPAGGTMRPPLKGCPFSHRTLHTYGHLQGKTPSNRLDGRGSRVAALRGLWSDRKPPGDINARAVGQVVGCRADSGWKSKSLRGRQRMARSPAQRVRGTSRPS